MLASKASSPLAIKDITEEQPRHRPFVHHRGNTNTKNNNCSSNSDNNSNSNINTIEIEWKETKTCKNKRVRFDPDMDWKLERSKAEMRHLRQQAGREIRKRIEVQKKQQQHDASEQASEEAQGKLSTRDRQKEAFLYICFCDVDLLVEQYNTNGAVVLTRLFDTLFEDAGIKTLSERKETARISTTTINGFTKNETDSWLWVSFFALQIEYRRIYDAGKTTAIRCRYGSTSNSDSTTTSTSTINHPQQNYSFVSRLSRNATKALFFIHWLSPVFRFQEKESKQRQVYSSIVGDNNRDGRDDTITTSSTARRFEDYVVRDRDKKGNEEDDNLLKDLRFQLDRFFGTAFGGVPSLESSRSPAEGSRENIDMDLGVYFATVRSSNDNADEIDEIGCDWAVCRNSCVDSHQNHNNNHKRRRRFAYELLNSESKHLLFLISAMPAFRSYYYYDCGMRNGDNKGVMIQQPCKKDNTNKDYLSSLLSPSSISDFSPGSNNSNSNTYCASEIDPKETSADIYCDNCPLLANYEYEFTQEICNLLFEST